VSAPDPFAPGGRQTDDEAILAAFRKWVEAVRATAARPREEPDAEFEGALARDSERMFEIAEMPVSGAVGRAVKRYLALRARDGGARSDEAALYRGKWEAGYDVTYVEMALAEDLSRFVRELTPLVAEALGAGRAALTEVDDGN
jgi:hypothetical protein